MMDLTQMMRSANRNARTDASGKKAPMMSAAEQAKALGSTVQDQGVEGEALSALQPAWNELPPWMRAAALMKGRV